MKYHVTHTTTYTYDDSVSNSLGVAYLVPRPLPWQQVFSTLVTTVPVASDFSQDVDYYGNLVTYYQVTVPHTLLEITSVSDVEVDLPLYDGSTFGQPWEGARPLVHPELAGAWRASDVAVQSQLAEHTDEAYRYGAQSLTPGRPLVEAVTELMQRVHSDFAYDKTVTTVTSTVNHIFEARGGVCQDFAHLMLACLRSHGLAVRYVSGYLSTVPPPGAERVVGADASHAWIAVWVPTPAGDATAPAEGQWLAVDPTNNQWANDRYVTVAWGRDYADVPPVKGVIFTDAKSSQLSVSVDVAPVP